jgi:thymidylate kinase
MANGRNNHERPFTVALIGPDGAGKTTIARSLERELSRPAKYLYMGVSRDSSNHMLPTSRLIHAVKRRRGAPPDTAGPPDPVAAPAPRTQPVPRRAAAALRSSLRLANLLAEELYRELLAWSYVRRGAIVLFDRHFFSDFYAYDVAPRTEKPLAQRLHGFVLRRLAPRPDLVIYLDAPAAVLLARKGEGTLEALSRRREDYRALAGVSRAFAIVDAAGPVDEVSTEVRRVIEAFGATRQVPTENRPGATP